VITTPALARTRTRFLCVALSAIVAAGAQVAFAQVSPVGAHHTTAGPGGGLDSPVSPTGGYVASVPLDLPRPRGPLPVPLSIVYTGTTRGGAAGQSWDVPLWYLRRSVSDWHRKPEATPDGSNRYVERIFVATGGEMQLMVKKGGVYVPFMGSEYQELRAEGDVWRLRTLSNLEYTFTPLAWLEGHVGHGFEKDLWILTEIRDGTGTDRVTLTYDTNGADRELTLSRIAYGYHLKDQKKPLYEIELAYDRVGAFDQVHDHDLEFTRFRRLSAVRVHARNNLDAEADAKVIRSYHLAYGTDPDTGRPSLSAVDVAGEEGTPGPMLPVARYNYGRLTTGGGTSDPRIRFGAPVHVPRPSTLGVDQVDDIATSEVTSDEYTSLQSGMHWVKLRVETTKARHLLRDFTGDGVADLVFAKDGKWWLYPSKLATNGVTFASSPLMQWDSSNGPAELHVQRTWRFAESTVAHEAGQFARESLITSETWAQFTDWDGDGRLDVIDVNGGQDLDHWKVWLNRAGTNQPIVWRPVQVRIGAAKAQLRSRGLRRADFSQMFPQLNWDDRLVIERSRSWWRAERQTCQRYTCGYPCDSCEWSCDPDDHLSCPADSEFERVWATDTITEWKLADINADGFQDLLTAGDPVRYCKRGQSWGNVPQCSAEPVDTSDPLREYGCTTYRYEWIWAGETCDEIPQITNPSLAYLNRMGPFTGMGLEVFSSEPRENGYSAPFGVGHWTSGTDDNLNLSGQPPPFEEEGGLSWQSGAYRDPNGSGKLRWHRANAYASSPNAFETDRHLACGAGSSSSTPIVAKQERAEADFNGDGCVDRIYLDANSGNWMVGSRRIDSPNLAFAVSESQETCGSNAHNVAGLVDLDGDGKVELVRVLGGQLYMAQLIAGEGENLHGVGRLVSFDNGYGAITRITYANAKQEYQTAHVASPEIVLRSIRTQVTDGSAPSLEPTYFAYGTAEQEYNPFLGRWVFAGYRRQLALSGRWVRGIMTSGVLTISELTPGAAPGSSLAQHASARRPYKQRRIEGLFNLYMLSQPDIVGGAPFAESTALTGATTLPIPPGLSYSPIECADLEPYFGTAVGFARCNAAAIVYTGTTEAWEGLDPPPSLRNTLTRRAMEEVDALGRPVRWWDHGDVRRTDDDVCTTVTYAEPAGGGPFPSLPRSMVITDCGWGDVRDDGKPGTPRILAATHLAYDELPLGQVSRGRMSAQFVDRYDETGYLDSHQVAAVTYDEAGLIDSVTSSRALGSQATKASTYERDGFGYTLTKIEEVASDVGQVMASTAGTSSWPSQPAWESDVNGVVTWTERDGLGRIAKVWIAGGQGGAQTTLRRFTYQDAGARQVTTESFPVDTTPGQEDSALERHRSVTVLDALGRPRFTQEELGADYGGRTVVSRYVEYNSLGQLVFAAEPFDASSAPFSPSQVMQWGQGVGNTFDRRGRLLRSVEAPNRNFQSATSVQDDIYVTSYQYGYLDGLAMVSRQGPSENASGTPDALHHDEIWRTALGRVVERNRKDPSGQRIDLVRQRWDRLGRLVTTNRYVDPATGNIAVSWNSQYDSLGNRLTSTEPGTAPQHTRYDEQGNPIESWWEDGVVRNITRSRYDGFGRIVERSLIRSVSGTENTQSTDRFHYDELSNDYSQPASDLRGRLSWTETDGVGAVFFAYDPFGRTSSTSYRYWENDQLIRESASYTAPGRLESLLLETPTTSDLVAYRHDSAGRVVTVHDGAGYAYWQADVTEWDGFVPSVTLGNGVRSWAQRSGAGRREIESWGVDTRQGPYRYSYLYDAAGRIGRESLGTPWSTDERGHEFDALGRLHNTVQFGGGWPGVEQYEHDALGNLVSRTSTTGAGDRQYEADPSDPDRLCRYATPGTSGPCDFRYDGLGNVESDTTQADERVFKYDAGGRILVIARGNYFAELLHGPAGRARTYIRGDEKRTYWHFGALIEERERSDGGRQVERSIPGPGGMIATRRSDGVRDTIVYNHGDGRAPRVFTDDDGNVVQAPTYHTYGELTQNGGSDPMTSTDNLWNGGDDIPELGVVLLGPRAYDPDLGRFLQRDPISVTSRASRANPYAFSFSDPVNYADPSGLTPRGWVFFVGLFGGGPDGGGNGGGGGDGGGGVGGWLATTVALSINAGFTTFGDPSGGGAGGGFGGEGIRTPGGAVTGPGMLLAARAAGQGLYGGEDFDYDSLAGGSYANLDGKLEGVLMAMTVNGQVTESRLPRWVQRELTASVAWWDGMSWGLGPVARNLAGYGHVIDTSSSEYTWGTTVAIGTQLVLPIKFSPGAVQASAARAASCAGGACGAPKCFAAGTLVRVGDTVAAIESLEIGQRVPNDAQACRETSFEDWSAVELTMSGSDGDQIELMLLRDPGWFSRFDVKLGAVLWLNLEELNVQGEALVVAIHGPVVVGRGPGCPITGTIRHHATSLRALEFDGSDATLHVTPNHPLYSLDRDEWVAAGVLEKGDLIATEAGSVRVTSSIAYTAVPTPVYNLEVHGVHQYYVHDAKVLAHNNYACVQAARDAIASVAKSLFKPMQCVECAAAMKDALVARGIQGQVLSIRAKGGADYMINHMVSVNNPITKNGYHEAIRVGDTVFDNYFRGGVPYDKYVRSLDAAFGIEITAVPF